jgi:hypothetical protein
MVLLSVSAFAQSQGHGHSGPGGGIRSSGPGSSHDRSSDSGKRDSQGVSGDHRSATSTTHTVTPKDAHGFKNYGQWVAAQHVAENLQIPGGVDALKTLMTGDNAVSLGKAIQQLRPDLSKSTIEVEVKTAETAGKKAEDEAKKTAKSSA